MISDIVLNEARGGDSVPVQKRLEVLTSLTVFNVSPTANILAQTLIDAGAVPQNFRSGRHNILLLPLSMNIEYLIILNI